jgi:hypothetical protein
MGGAFPAVLDACIGEWVGADLTRFLTCLENGDSFDCGGLVLDWKFGLRDGVSEIDLLSLVF